jgi:GNAT superfamily N-acetyltransferase
MPVTSAFRSSIFTAVPVTTVRRTYLEMAAPPVTMPPTAQAEGVRLSLVGDCPWELYRRLYVEVGGPWHWIDRLSWTESQFREWLAGPSSIWLLSVEGVIGGFFELRRHEDRSVEIAYFGLVPQCVGRGLGKFLLARAIEEAWRLEPARVWLHTCTLDHPAALPNYLKAGFRVTGEEEYQADLP